MANGSCPLVIATSVMSNGYADESHTSARTSCGQIHLVLDHISRIYSTARKGPAMKPNAFKTGALAVVLLGLAARVVSGTAVAQDIEPGELVRDLHAIFGEHHDRAVHAKGLILDAAFEPAEEARRLSKAGVFAGKLQATVRLSDTTGLPDIPDADPSASPHGLAVRFRLADGSEMDLISHSFNGFPAANAAEFDGFLKAAAASGPAAAKPTPIEKYLQAHPN